MCLFTCIGCHYYMCARSSFVVDNYMVQCKQVRVHRSGSISRPKLGMQCRKGTNISIRTMWPALYNSACQAWSQSVRPCDRCERAGCNGKRWIFLRSFHRSPATHWSSTGRPSLHCLLVDLFSVPWSWSISFGISRTPAPYLFSIRWAHEKAHCAGRLQTCVDIDRRPFIVRGAAAGT